MFVPLLVVALPTLVSAANADAWKGSIRCEIQVTAPGYFHQETQTWTLTGAPPTTQGAYLNFPATWTANGQGWHDRSGSTSRRVAIWTAAVPGANSPVRGAITFFRTNSNQLFVQVSQGQLSASDGYRGTDQYINTDGFARPQARLVARLYEFRFERIEASPTDTTLTGSKTTEFVGAVAPLHPGDAKAVVTLTWALGKDAAPPMPPPTLPPPPPPPPASPDSSGAPNGPPAASLPAINPPGSPPPNPRVSPSAPVTGVREQPVITQVSPNSVAAGAKNVSVTLTGRGTRWDQATTRLMLMNSPGITLAGPESITSPTSMTVRLNVDAAAAAGAREITVLNTGLGAGSDVITVPDGLTVTVPNLLATATVVPLGVVLAQQYAGGITVVSPNGGENFIAGGIDYPISWKHQLGATQKFDIDLSIDGGATWNVFRSAMTPRTLTAGVVGEYFSVIDAATSNALVRVRATGKTSPSDVSDQPFTLTTPSVRVIKPAAGDKWKIGSKPSPEIVWAHNMGSNANFWIALSRNGGQSWEIINGWGLNSSGDWFEVSGPMTTQAIIQVRTSTDPSIVAESARFTIGF